MPIVSRLKMWYLGLKSCILDEVAIRYPNEIVCSNYENNTLYSQPRKTAHLNLQKSSRRSGYGRAPFEHRDKDSNTRMSQPCRAWPSLDKDSIVQCRSIPVLHVVCSYPKSLYTPKNYPLKLFIPVSPSSVKEWKPTTSFPHCSSSHGLAKATTKLGIIVNMACS
jgi:hypothetical protein